MPLSVGLVRSWRNNPPRHLVVDTNVLVSGLLFGGAPDRLLDWIRERKVTLWFSKQTLRELTLVLQYPKFQRVIERLGSTHVELLRQLSGRFRRITPIGLFNLIPNDPIDNELLSIAVTAHVDAIVTGDQEVLDLKEIEKIPILSVRQFLTVVGK